MSSSNETVLDKIYRRIACILSSIILTASNTDADQQTSNLMFDMVSSRATMSKGGVVTLSMSAILNHFPLKDLLENSSSVLSFAL
jgi:hypothetical protein